jgi:hypothetical protein
MNNIQFWIWLIVIVVTLIARARKKPSAPERRASSGPVPQREEGPKPLSFEELLKEIRAAKTQTPKPVVDKPDRYKGRDYEVIDYDDPLPDEPKSLEKTDYTYPQPKKGTDIYEKAKQEAFFRPSLEETLKLQDTDMRFGQFKGYKQATRPDLAAEFAKEFRNPSGFRKAFIMSEILARRF